MKKKGVTLIEIVIAMGLVFMMVGVVDSMLISNVKSYKNIVAQNKGFNYLYEAIAIIEKEVNVVNSVVNTTGNIISINYWEGTSLKV